MARRPGRARDALAPDQPDPAVRLSAKVDYAVRAAAELAGRPPDGPVKGETIAAAQDISLKFLESILSELRRAGIVASQRGTEGGYWLARPAEPRSRSPT